MGLRLVANVRREQSKLDGLLANVCESSPTFSFIERRAVVYEIRHITDDVIHWSKEAELV